MGNKMNKVMCGLWHAHVEKSEYNDNGACPCTDCFGTHCHKCSEYWKLQDANMALDIFEKTKCQLCMAHMERGK